MNFIRPILETTEHSPDFREWTPSSFDGFLKELEHIVNSCEGQDPLPLFRGQANYEWLLDSTFVRNCISHMFAISEHHILTKTIRQSVTFHRTIVSLLLLKYGTVWRLNQELIDRANADSIDPWFELLKNKQQYPENDYFINGTFLLDWSRSQDIGLYFAIYQGKGGSRNISPVHGALWICDAIATGKTLQTKQVGDILSLMSGEEFLNGNKTFPLLFHPPKQSFQPRSKNQVPVYIAQMDFRYDVAEVLASYEDEINKKVFIKLILDDDFKHAAANYLESKGITEQFVYPE